VAPAGARLSSAAVQLIEVLGLEEVLDARPAELSVGTRRLAAIARSVVRWPSVLLLDEPAASLSAPRARELGRLVARLASECGLGILLVEHNVEFVMACSDRVIAIDVGSKIAEGSPDEVRADRAALKAYLGVEPTPPAEVAR
jgi:ABC-type branched-subunit amino acid transport system ATPase component